MTRLTHQDIIDIVGALDDARMAEIIETGASPAELMEAYTWLASDDMLADRLHREPHGMVARLCEILSADMPEPEER